MKRNKKARTEIVDTGLLWRWRESKNFYSWAFIEIKKNIIPKSIPKIIIEFLFYDVGVVDGARTLILVN